jgi:hypothetical protein
MSRNSTENPIDPLLAGWIEERETGDPEVASPLLAADRELLELFSEVRTAAPDKMSEAEARNTLAAVRRRAAAASASSLHTRNGVLAMAAVLAGLAIGLASLAPREPGGNPSATANKIIKKVSFESTHEGKVVRFQLELARVR